MRDALLRMTAPVRLTFFFVDSESNPTCFATPHGVGECNGLHIVLGLIAIKVLVRRQQELLPPERGRQQLHFCDHFRLKAEATASLQRSVPPEDDSYSCTSVISLKVEATVAQCGFRL